MSRARKGSAHRATETVINRQSVPSKMTNDPAKLEPMTNEWRNPKVELCPKLLELFAEVFIWSLVIQVSFVIWPSSFVISNHTSHNFTACSNDATLSRVGMNSCPTYPL